MSYLKKSKSARKFDIDFTEKEFGMLRNLIGEVLIVSGVIKIKTKNGLKSVWEFENRSDSLYFGNTILDDLADEILNDDEIVKAVKEGKVKIKLYECVSKSGRTYYNYKELD